MKYKIIVEQRVPLTYIVDSYEIVESTLIKFKDRKTGEVRYFDSRICQIIEVDS
jgi:hypothetical protein